MKVISLVKGFDPRGGGMTNFSQVMGKIFGVDVSVLMGANVADEVARGSFCETTIGPPFPYLNNSFAPWLKLFSFSLQRPKIPNIAKPSSVSLKTRISVSKLWKT